MTLHIRQVHEFSNYKVRFFEIITDAQNETTKHQENYVLNINSVIEFYITERFPTNLIDIRKFFAVLTSKIWRPIGSVNVTFHDVLCFNCEEMSGETKAPKALIATDETGGWREQKLDCQLWRIFGNYQSGQFQQGVTDVM
jgi:hypothetical protein